MRQPETTPMPVTWADIPTHAGARQKLLARLAMTYPLSTSDVEERIRRAILTLEAQRDRERGWLRVRSNWPECLREALAPADEAWARNDELSAPKRFEPTPEDVSRYLDDIGWLNPLERQEQDVIFWRAKDFAYRDIADRLARRRGIGMSERGAKREHRNAITKLWLVAALTAERQDAA